MFMPVSILYACLKAMNLISPNEHSLTKQLTKWYKQWVYVAFFRHPFTELSPQAFRIFAVSWLPSISDLFPFYVVISHCLNPVERYVQEFSHHTRILRTDSRRTKRLVIRQRRDTVLSVRSTCTPPHSRTWKCVSRKLNCIWSNVMLSCKYVTLSIEIMTEGETEKW